MGDDATQVLLQSPHATKQFDRAPADVRRALERAAARLRQDPQHGTFVALAQAPAGTRSRWESRIGPLTNLWKLDLPQGWRALYTIGSEADRRAVIVLEIVSHKQYDRLLGYG